MELAGRLKRCREKAGLSQGDLAKEMNLTRQTVSRWECGNGYPDLENLILLSKIYGISVDELLKGKDESDRVLAEKVQMEKRLKYNCSLLSFFVGLILLAVNIIYFDYTWGGERGFLPYMKYWILLTPIALHVITIIPFILGAVFMWKCKMYRELPD